MRVVLFLSFVLATGCTDLVRLFLETASSSDTPLTAERFKLFSRNVAEIKTLNAGKWTPQSNYQIFAIQLV